MFIILFINLKKGKYRGFIRTFSTKKLFQRLKTNEYDSKYLYIIISKINISCWVCFEISKDLQSKSYFEAIPFIWHYCSPHAKEKIEYVVSLNTVRFTFDSNHLVYKQ